MQLARRSNLLRIVRLQRRWSEDTNNGSVIILAPVIAILATVLAALLVDINYLYTTQTELQNRVEIAATAATNNFDALSYYTESTITINPALARTIAFSQLMDRTGHGYKINRVNINVATNSICINATASVRLPAFGALLGGPHNWTVSARSIARLGSSNSANAAIAISSC